MQAAQKLIKLVKFLQGDLKPPAKEADIQACEKRIGYALPSGLREFYSLSNGAEFGESLWEFFTLDTIESHQSYRKTLSSSIQIDGGFEVSRTSLLVFADSMIDAPSYWVSVDSDSPYLGYIFFDGISPWQIAATSFEEFIDKLAEDPDNNFIGW